MFSASVRLRCLFNFSRFQWNLLAALLHLSSFYPPQYVLLELHAKCTCNPFHFLLHTHTEKNEQKKMCMKRAQSVKNYLSVLHRSLTSAFFSHAFCITFMRAAFLTKESKSDNETVFMHTELKCTVTTVWFCTVLFFCQNKMKRNAPIYEAYKLVWIFKLDSKKGLLFSLLLQLKTKTFMRNIHSA